MASRQPTTPPGPRPDAVGQADVAYAPARDILMKATGFMESYDFVLNPYSGCSFGCTYCYAAFFSRTPGDRENWGRWVRVKENAVALLEREETRPSKRLDGKTIYMSTVTDPYQPIERDLGLTRGLLDVMARHTPRLVVQTRSPDVTRDIDLFRRIEANGGRVQVNMTVTTDDEDVRKEFEPWCPSNASRLRAIGEVAAAGVQACITMTPLLLVNAPERFAADLLATGVERFIIQTFHFEKGKYTAQTRDEAIAIMAAKLGCGRAAFRREYEAHYDRAHAVLRERLPQLGEGKDGFRPPFGDAPADAPGPLFR